MPDETLEVRVARIGKPHGIRGEVTVEIFTDSPSSRFEAGAVLQVRMLNSTELYFDTLTVEKARWNNKILLLKFEEFADRNTAEALRNAELFAHVDRIHDEDGWYADELVGLEVYEGSTNSSKIGEVVGLISGDAQDLLELVLLDGREVLIPFVDAIVPEIDKEQGAVVITPPPGLLELKQD